MRTALEKNLLDTLIELENAVKAMPTANPKPNLLPIFSRIDELTRQLPPGTDHNLLHYLRKKSYEKARLHLQDRDAENQQGNRRDCHADWRRRISCSSHFRQRRVGHRR
jgi:hypothetical protein